MLRCIACTVLIAMVASWAEAAAVHYRYDGKPFSCFGDKECIYDYETNTLPAFEASLWIDENLYPGGLLGGSELMLFASINRDEMGVDSIIGYSVRTTRLTYNFSVQKEEAYNQAFSDYPQFDFVTFDGIMSEALEGLVGETAYFMFFFDESGYIFSWEGDSGLQGASLWDWGTNPTGDSYASEMRSIGPGRWVRLTPVPLPFSAILYATGLALLGALGVYRKRCHREPAPS